jgi:hypothetical protein
VRLCRDRIELWTRETDRLAFVAQQDAPFQAGPVVLFESLVALLTCNQVAARAVNVDFDVAIESARLPVVALEAGTTLWSIYQMTALLEHRLAQTYADEESAVGTWQNRLDYRPGDGHGVGYALAPFISDSIKRASAAVGRRCRSLQPAVSWGWEEFAPRRRHATRGKTLSCWIWLEHDRALAAIVDRGRIVALNPCAARPRNGDDSMRCAALEAMRSGIDAAQLSVAVAGWESDAAWRPADHSTYLSVAA